MTENDSHGCHLIGYFSKVCGWLSKKKTKILMTENDSHGCHLIGYFSKVGGCLSKILEP